ncbi:MAG: hypothetical protein OXI73_07830 [Rhodospirillales bacterium]|nr:hypothetical protein [Rhodospirillales bacterium]
MPNTQSPRVPPGAPADLLRTATTIQVNHCRNPNCANYGVPARTAQQKPGPSPDRDPNYKVQSTNKGLVPAIRCKSCGESPPLRSNHAIAAEISRLTREDQLRTPEERVSCCNPECVNHSHPIGHMPAAYQKRGFATDGARRYRCKACGSSPRVSEPARLHARSRELAVDVFSRIANKSPVRGIVRGARLNSPGAYYRILDFIHRRCRAQSGAVDRALIDGRMRLRAAMHIESDSQVYTLNWISRMDRRNVDISSYCSVDAASRFILGLHCNFDAAADAFAVNAEAAKTGDMARPEPFRQDARYWLAGDELRAGRSKNFTDPATRRGLADAIELLYSRAASRADVEDIELEHMDTEYRTPTLRDGLLVHMPYTTYAHWYLLWQVLDGAGVERVQVHFDIDSMSRAAFLCSFRDAVQAKRAHGFYVKYSKHFTVDQRRRIVAESRSLRAAERRALPAEERDDVDLITMKRLLGTGSPHGKWNDLWFEHPNPTMNEPHKAMCWLTPDNSLDTDAQARMFLAAGLARVDNVFQMTRRLINAFERPLGTSSSQNAVWHGYQPYNPAMIGKYLTIFRTVANFISVGTDGKTPAMRLGLAEEPLTYEDILWPGERAPRPRPVRRKGRRLSGLRHTPTCERPYRVRS